MDRRIRKTKKALRDGLAEMMKEKPVSAITVSALTDRVDINRGTFYIHYTDIVDMLHKLEEETYEELRESVRIESNDPEGTLHDVISDVLTYVEHNSDWFRAMLGPNGDPAFREMLEGLIRERCIHSWTLVFGKKKADQFDIYSCFILGGLVGMVQYWLNNGMKETVDEMTKMIEEIVLNGVNTLR